MKEHIDSYAEELETHIPPIRDAVISKLKQLHLRHPLANVSHYSRWKRFFEAAERNPEEVKFYIYQCLNSENKQTLKIELDANPVTGEQALRLPLTSIQAFELHTSITPDDYRLLCKYAAICKIEHFEKILNRLAREKKLPDLEGVDRAFAKSILIEHQILTDMLNDLEKNDPDINWWKFIEIYCTD